MPYKALVMYASVTGNTKEVAVRMHETFQRMGFESELCDLVKHDLKADPRYLDDYDIVCLGSPIMAGLPHRSLLSRFGLGYDPKNQVVWKRGKTLHDHGFDGQEIKAVAFTTYGGCAYGPDEATATLELEKLYLELNGCSIVGEFCCAGRELKHEGIDYLRNKLNMSVPLAAQRLADYCRNPEDPQFAALTEEERRVYDKAAGGDDSWGDQIMTPVEVNGMSYVASKFFHYDLQHRPNKGDLFCAECLIENIVQDYFYTPDGKARQAKSIYKIIL